eukprot:415419-Hanusia_phi.AAC.1
MKSKYMRVRHGRYGQYNNVNTASSPWQGAKSQYRTVGGPQWNAAATQLSAQTDIRSKLEKPSRLELVSGSVTARPNRTVLRYPAAA